jgi:hypothetical protein
MDTQTQKASGTIERDDNGTTRHYTADGVIITRWNGNCHKLYWSQNLGRYVAIPDDDNA